MTNSCRTTLIEPNQLFREGLKHLLAGTRFEVSSEFGAMDAALKGASIGTSGGSAPDLLIMGLSNSEVRDLRPLREAYPTSRIVVLADELTVNSLREAMAAGIDGFLIKDVSPEALVQSLHLILLGEKVFPTNLASMLIQMNTPTAQTGTASVRGLSPREQEILQALVTGASNKLIANRLGITEATVKVHLKTLLRKIDVNNRTQAAIWALNHGITANPANDLRAVSA